MIATSTLLGMVLVKGVQKLFGTDAPRHSEPESRFNASHTPDRRFAERRGDDNSLSLGGMRFQAFPVRVLDAEAFRARHPDAILAVKFLSEAPGHVKATPEWRAFVDVILRTEDESGVMIWFADFIS